MWQGAAQATPSLGVAQRQRGINFLEGLCRSGPSGPT